MANESFAQGLLQNLLSQQQPQGLSSQDIMAAMSSRSPMAAVMAASVPQTTQAIGAGVRGMMGGITGQKPYSASEAYNKAMQQLAQKEGFGTTAASLTAMAQAASVVGRTEDAMNFSLMATEAAQREEEKTKELTLRRSLITQANNLDLPAVAAALEVGGDIPTAQKQIFETSAERATGAFGRRGRQVLAQTMNAPPEIMAAIRSGDLDGLSPAQFTEVVQGRNADLKFYTNDSGEVKGFRVSQQGTVYNDNTQSWGSLPAGYRPAPIESKDISEADGFGAAVWNGTATRFLEKEQGAENAVKNLELSNQLVSIIDDGINTGTFANIETGFTAALLDLGLIDKDTPEAQRVIKTQEYIADIGRKVGENIKMFGSGTGLSDRDREYAESISGGKIAMTEDAIRNILAMDMYVNRNLINNFNNQIDELSARNIGGDNLDLFKKNISLTPAEINLAQRNHSESNPSVVVNQETGTTLYKVRDKWFYASGREYK